MLGDMPKEGILHGILLLLFLRQLEDALGQPGDVVTVLLHATRRAPFEVEVEEASLLASLEEAALEGLVAFLKLGERESLEADARDVFGEGRVFGRIKVRAVGPIASICRHREFARDAVG